MDVRTSPGIGIVDDLVDQLHDHAVGFGNGIRIFFIVQVLFGAFQFAQNIVDGRVIRCRMVEKVDVFDDVFRQGNIVFDGLGLEKAFDHIPFQDVIRIVDDDLDLPVHLSDGHPEFPPQVFLFQVLQ